MWSNILYPLTTLLQCCYRQYHVHGSTFWFFLVFFTNILINLQMKSLTALFLQSVSTFLQFGGSFWLWYIMNWSTSLSRVIRHIRKHTVPNKTNNRKKNKNKNNDDNNNNKKQLSINKYPWSQLCVSWGCIAVLQECHIAPPSALRSYRAQSA